MFFLRKRKTELFTVSPFFALLKLLQIHPEIVVLISIVIKILASSDNLSTWRWLCETFTPLKHWKYLENFFARYLQFCLKGFGTFFKVFFGVFIVNTRNISLLISVLLKQWQCFCLWGSDTLRNLFTELECTIVFSLATSAKFENLLFIRSDCNRSPDGSAARILSMWVSQNYQNICLNKLMGSRCWINHWGKLSMKIMFWLKSK